MGKAVWLWKYNFWVQTVTKTIRVWNIILPHSILQVCSNFVLFWNNALVPCTNVRIWAPQRTSWWNNLSPLQRKSKYEILEGLLKVHHCQKVRKPHLCQSTHSVVWEIEHGATQIQWEVWQMEVSADEERVCFQKATLGLGWGGVGGEVNFRNDIYTLQLFYSVHTLFTCIRCISTSRKVCVRTCRSVRCLLAGLQHCLLHHTDAVAVHHLLQHVEDLFSSRTFEGKNTWKHMSGVRPWSC